MSDEQYVEGMRVRREVLGDEHVDRAIAQRVLTEDPAAGFPGSAGAIGHHVLVGWLAAVCVRQ